MIKENQGLLNKIHVVLDAVVIVISYVLSWYLRFRSGIFEMDPWCYIIFFSYILRKESEEEDWKHGISFRRTR